MQEAAGKQPCEGGSGWPNVEMLLGALAGLAAAHLLAIMAIGGYDVRLLGMRFSSHTLGLPLLLTTIVLLARWLSSLRRIGLRRSLRGFLPWGPAACGGGLVLYAVLALRQPVPLDTIQVAAVALIATCGFSFAWLAYGGGWPRAGRAVVSAAFLVAMWGLAQSLSSAGAWGKTFNVSRWRYEPSKSGTADAGGFLLAPGAGASVSKCAVGFDWRNAAVIAPSGSASCSLAGTEGADIIFSVARWRGASASTITVSAGSRRAQKTLWREASTGLPDADWRDVSVALPAGAQGEMVFGVAGPDGADSVLVANPRFVPGPAKRPNVILILIDALRADRLGLYGCSRPTSPEIDAVAAGGVVFEQCFSQAPWTIPSMSTIFTGLHPSAHGAQSYNSILSPTLETLAEKLRGAGRYTAAIQSNPLLQPEMGIARGFNEYLFPGAVGLKRERKHDTCRAEIVTDRAVAWIKARANSSFFLYLHYMDVHRPYADVPGLERFGKAAIDTYDAELAYLSASLKALFDFLASSGVMSETIVVLASDHGEQFMEHGMDGHARDVHVEELRVPLVIWAPGVKAGLRVKSRVRNIDIAPTVLDLAGVPAPKSCEGESLMPALRGESMPDSIVWSELVRQQPAGQCVVSLMEGRYRFIVTNPEDPPTARYEIYDVQRDPGEFVNLAAANPDLISSLEGKISGYLAGEKALMGRLVPREQMLPMTPERIEQLRSLGYIAPGN